LDELRAGEKLLIVRKYGGLGDILISSMIFPMLAEQYPHVQVTYAVPKSYHPLFEGSGLALRPYEDVFHGESQYSRGAVQPELLTQYDLIEDISSPCRHWEIFFERYGGTNGCQGNGLRWRNRVDMWSRWFGLRVENPRTNIVIREGEQVAARRLLAQTVGTDKPVCLIAPFSGNSIKSYPWFFEVARKLKADGWAPALLYQSPVPGSLPTLSGLSIRQMGAVCSVADLIVSTDTAAFHWGGVLGRPTIGIYSINDGATYAKYYPTARVVQTCDTPCIMSRYAPGGINCPKHTDERIPRLHRPGMGLSRCYPSASADRIVEAAQALHPARRA
jgi:hypothetical protein